MLLEKTEAMCKEFDIYLDTTLGSCGFHNVRDLAEMDSDDLKAVYQLCIVAKKIEEMYIEQAKAIDEINNKLNMLIDRH